MIPVGKKMELEMDMLALVMDSLQKVSSGSSDFITRSLEDLNSEFPLINWEHFFHEVRRHYNFWQNVWP